MTSILHRHTKVNYPSAVKGEGVYITDSTGKRYLDMCGGAAVSCLGHNDQRVKEAIIKQLDALPFAHSGFFTTPVMEELGEFLVNSAPSNISKAYLVSGGSEAIESAIKLARQYALEKNQPSRRYIISRLQSYHGNTLGALSAGGNQWRRAQFEPLLMETRHISACYAYRHMRDDEDIYAYGQRMANELQTMIEELGAENVLAFMAEPVVGATLGAVPATEGYFKRIRQICDENGILLIADEVMCGLGRTGTYFASEAEGIQPDIITVAKGLGGGYQPIGAALLSQDIFDTISNGSGFFQHGHTFIGHACAAAAALATQQIVINENLVGKVKENGVRLKKHLRDRLGEHAHVGDIRGRGFFLGLELVKDKETKESFDPSERIHAKIKAKAMENGLMCYPMGGTIDGRIGDHILLAPAFITSDAELQQGVELLAKSIEAVV